MDVLGAIGLTLGLSGVVVTLALGAAQTSELRVRLGQLGSYLTDFHSQMLSRFDRLDEASARVLARIAPEDRNV